MVLKASNGPQCTQSTAISSVTLWAVQLGERLSACTVHVYH